MPRIWNIHKPDLKLQQKLSLELKISPLLVQVLINRGIKTAGEAKEFLKPSLNSLLDPFDLPDIHKAVSRIKAAEKNKEKVMIFGDYDVDGLTSTAVLKRALEKLGLEVLCYIPHRVKEGYGVNKQAIKEAVKNKVSLFITVDSGVNSIEEVKELNAHKIDVIITDHHEPMKDKLPSALAVINPKRSDSKYKFRDLAGVGVAYKLAQAITGDDLKQDLDLVCLGTIADVSPLSGENRIIAKFGLKCILNTKKIGLLALLEAGGIKGKEITTTSVNYILGPRINAAGRMDTPDTSLKLLLSESCEEAKLLADTLNQHNRSRKKIEEGIISDVMDIINRDVNFKEHSVLVLHQEGWHHGVLGVVASKIMDRFYRPTVIISEGEALCKGSARSIKNFHIFDALVECSDLLDSFGGHDFAAGLTIHKDNIAMFKQRINTLAKNRLRFEDLLPSIDVDTEAQLSDLNERLAHELDELGPFGAGNPKPMFLTKNLKLKSEPRVMGRDTLKFWVTDGEVTHQALGFGMGGLKENILEAESFDLVYSPSIDSWQEEDSVQLEIKDIKFYKKF